MGLPANHSGEYVPGKPETGLGTLCMQERGWNPVVGSPDGKV